MPDTLQQLWAEISHPFSWENENNLFNAFLQGSGKMDVHFLAVQAARGAYPVAFNQSRSHHRNRRSDCDEHGDEKHRYNV